MVQPTAPVVPSDENCRAGPEPALHDGVDLVDGPLHPVGDVAERMLALGVVGVHP